MAYVLNSLQMKAMEEEHNESLTACEKHQQQLRNALKAMQGAQITSSDLWVLSNRARLGILSVCIYVSGYKCSNCTS